MRDMTETNTWIYIHLKWDLYRLLSFIETKYCHMLHIHSWWFKLGSFKSFLIVKKSLGFFLSYLTLYWSVSFRIFISCILIFLFPQLNKFRPNHIRTAWFVCFLRSYGICQHSCCPAELAFLTLFTALLSVKFTSLSRFLSTCKDWQQVKSRYSLKFFTA